MIEQTGAAHTAYNVVTDDALAPKATAVPVPSSLVFQPVNTFCDAPEPFVMPHEELFHVGAVHVPP